MICQAVRTQCKFGTRLWDSSQSPCISNTYHKAYQLNLDVVATWLGGQCPQRTRVARMPKPNAEIQVQQPIGPTAVSDPSFSVLVLMKPKALNIQIHRLRRPGVIFQKRLEALGISRFFPKSFCICYTPQSSKSKAGLPQIIDPAQNERAEWELNAGADCELRELNGG